MSWGSSGTNSSPLCGGQANDRPRRDRHDVKHLLLEYHRSLIEYDESSAHVRGTSKKRGAELIQVQPLNL